jgi:hypothetical protein
MFNTRAYNENGRVLRRTWIVTTGARPQLRSRWSIQDSTDIVEAGRCGPSEQRNQPVTMSCETETIAACA